MKFIWVLTVWLCLIPFLPGVSAEYYEFIDKNGVKQFTDNLSEIPEDQRPGLNIHQSIISPEKKEPEKEDSENQTTGITLKSITSKKDELDTVYKTIVKKKESLVEQKKTIGNEKYNEMVTQLNSEIIEYQKKVDVYEKLVDQYNKQINKPPQK